MTYICHLFFMSCLEPPISLFCLVHSQYGLGVLLTNFSSSFRCRKASSKCEKLLKYMHYTCLRCSFMIWVIGKVCGWGFVCLCLYGCYYICTYIIVTFTSGGDTCSGLPPSPLGVMIPSLRGIIFPSLKGFLS